MVTLALTEPQAHALQWLLEDKIATARLQALHTERLEDLREVARALAVQGGQRR